jgi:hypothetical protein
VASFTEDGVFIFHNKLRKYFNFILLDVMDAMDAFIW